MSRTYTYVHKKLALMLAICSAKASGNCLRMSSRVGTDGDEDSTLTDRSYCKTVVTLGLVDGGGFGLNNVHTKIISDDLQK